MAAHSSNLSVLNMAWDSTDKPATASASASEAASKPFRVTVTGPPTSTQSSTAPNTAAPTDAQSKTSAAIPKLTESEAYASIRLFHNIGLKGHDEELFEELGSADPMPTPSQIDVSNQPPLQSMLSMMNNSALPAVKEDVPVSPTMEQNNTTQGMNGHSSLNPMLDGAGMMNGGGPLASVPGDSFIDPMAMNGGTQARNAVQSSLDIDQEIGKTDAWLRNNFTADEAAAAAQQPGQIPSNGAAVAAARTGNHVADMDDHKDITKADLEQFGDMLNNTEKLIGDMLEMCNYNGYGLDHPDPLSLQQPPQQGDWDTDELSLTQEMRFKANALQKNIDRYHAYVSTQLSQYNFDLASNAIVDLMGVKHTMSFRPQQGYRTFDASTVISSQGYVLYNGKRLTPHYFFNRLDENRRREIGLEVGNTLNYYLRKGYFDMSVWRYPTQDSLKGVTPILIPHFKDQCKLFYQLPAKWLALQRDHNLGGVDQRETMLDHLLQQQQQQPQQQPQHSARDDCYCVIVFPNHKRHLHPAVWSRSVSLFDNVGRGSMLPFIENCTSTEKGNGWGILLMNPNERYCQSKSFPTKLKYNYEGVKDTETLTVPHSESSLAHTVQVWKNFILPKVVNTWKCKLLFLSHCDGGHDIVHLLETQPECREHVIGIAMLDFYNWSLSEFSKNTRQIIEQKAAVYMSLYGANESGYGLEPSAAKSPVTIFRTANKDARYSPCFNAEAVIRFFKSKIELHKQN